MPQPSRDQHERGMTVGEASNDLGSSTHLTQNSLKWIVGSDAPPVLRRKPVVAQGVFDALGHEQGGVLELQLPKAFATTKAAFFLASVRFSWAWMAFIMAITSRTLVCGTCVLTFRSLIAEPTRF